jgi:hypothetical protein
MDVKIIFTADADFDLVLVRSLVVVLCGSEIQAVGNSKFVADLKD